MRILMLEVMRMFVGGNKGVFMADSVRQMSMQTDKEISQCFISSISKQKKPNPAQ
jgi:hypothetical protein